MPLILVVDDCPDDRDICRFMLDDDASSHRFVTAESGEEAIEAILRERPDCVLLDHSLPDMTGLDVLQRLKDHPHGAALIMLTGNSSTEVAIEALRLGAADYVDKARLSRDALRRSVRNALEKRALVLERSKARQKLERTVEELKRRNHEIRSFYHTLSHELKTPLTAIQEFVALVLDGVAGPINDEQREYLEIARQNCGRVALHVNDILDITRLETGKLSLELGVVRVEDLLEEAVRAMESIAAERDIALRSRVEDGLPAVRADEARVAQIVGNLLGNALKFTEPGGWIELRARRVDDGWVEVAVRDAGKGIAPELKDRVFDRLVQVGNGDSVLESGLGLGLNICRDLVELHGGRIDVDSEVGRGSTFRFTLPAIEQDSEVVIPPT
ncbi:MAG: ATP-binding protein [Planctomycetota bacterium JB042]